MTYFTTTDLDKALQFEDRAHAHEIADGYAAHAGWTATVCHAPGGFVVRCFKKRGHKAVFEGWIK